MLFSHCRQQRLELLAVARQHRLDLGSIAQYHADIIKSDVLDPVKPVNHAELNIDFVPRALWRNELTGYNNNTVRVSSAAGHSEVAGPSGRRRRSTRRS